MLGQIQAQDAELRARAEALQRANKELEAFTYTVSHDLRAPLRSISGFAHLLGKNHAEHLNADAQDLLRRIRLNAQKMAQLIDDLLAFSQIDAHPLKLEEVDPGAIAADVFDELSSQDKPRQVQFVAGEHPRVKADPALLRQVYANLIGNALKYTRDTAQPEIQAGSIRENGQTVYFIRDNGAGFDMQHAGRLFRIFQRLHPSSQFEGTGVGLAIVQRIVERHGGKIWASAQPGQGATFTFTLSAHGPAA
jgi:light-regulated signal transduction histidine kinase (bacteriophytochrome)